MARRHPAPAATGAPQALPDDGTGGVTRYRQLASVLRHRIVSGEYQVGDKLPTVEHLAQLYGIAKVTVRQAFALLAEEGFVSSQRGRGTHVIKADAAPDARLRSAINDDAVHANDLEIRILETQHDVALPPALAWQGAPAGRYVLVRKLHIHDGLPFCLIEMYVAASIFNRFPAGGEHQHKLLHLLRQVAGDRLGPMHQSLSVEPADYRMTSHLAYAFGAPVAKMARTIVDHDGQVVMAGWFWYRGDRFILDMTIPAQLTEHYPWLAIPSSR